jgi:hypothetical protein
VTPSHGSPQPSSQTSRHPLALALFLRMALSGSQLAARVQSGRATGKQDLDVALQDLVKGTMAITSGGDSDRGFDRTARAVEQITQTAVKLLSLPAFAEAIVFLMDLSDTRVCPKRMWWRFIHAELGWDLQHLEKTLVLFCARLENVKPSRRPEITLATVAVLRRVTSLLREGAREPPVGALLETLGNIAPVATDGEVASLADVHVVLLERGRTSSSSKATIQIFNVLRQLA